MKRRIVKIIEKVTEIMVLFIGEAIKVVCLLLALEFYLEGKRLEMWLCIIIGYILEIKLYKEFLLPYTSPIPNEKSKK